MKINFKQYKWIIDTDIGDDIDDAFAIEYAIFQKLDIVGITTVFRTSNLRAKLTSYILEKMGQPINVYAGLDHPLKNAIDAIQKKERYLTESQLIKYQDNNWLPHYIDEANNSMIQEQNAIDYLIDSFNNSNGQLAIIALGPLTNIARAIQKCPSIVKKIPIIVIMGSNVFEDKNEYNIMVDPEAAKIVMESNIKIFVVGSNITWKASQLTKQEESQLETNSPVGAVNKMMLEKWHNMPLYCNRITCMHDVLAIYCLIHQDRIETKKCAINVDLSNKGKTTIKKRLFHRNAIVVTNVNKDVFIKEFLEVIKNEKSLY